MERILTRMKVSLLGGHAQGILTTWPAALVIPSQSPVPVGFKPEGCPNWGTSEGSTSRLTGAAEVVAAKSTAAKGTTENANFIVAGQLVQWESLKSVGAVASSLKECMIRPALS
jgi:hypothetical protein